MYVVLHSTDLAGTPCFYRQDPPTVKTQRSMLTLVTVPCNTVLLNSAYFISKVTIFGELSYRRKGTLEFSMYICR